MTKTVSINGTDYTVGEITVKAARTADFTGKGIDFNIALVAASLVAGGNDEATRETVEAVPFFRFNDLLAAAMEVNGLKLAGENQPAGPAELTSSTSTEA